MNDRENVIFKQIEIGPMQNFAYFIGDQKTKQILVVDPGWDGEYISQEAKNNNFVIVGIFLTHGHPDHTGGMDDLLRLHDVPVYISAKEAFFYMPRHKNVQKVEDGQRIKAGDLEFECILTPGHTPGCQCLRYKDILITGDTLFVDGCGRCDLPGGSAKVMYNTLYNIIMKLPDSITIYPGHAYGDALSSTLGSQKETNPYLQCKSEKEFLEERM